MIKSIIFLLLFFSLISNTMAASWMKLNENKTSKLSVDKQSILQKEQLKRAWVKIEYKSPQKNIESPDKEYDLSKLLWYFDCTAQKSATSQVFQYLNDQLVYSAGIDIKGAEFIEPVPETDFDLAMRYVCATHKSVSPSINAKAATKATTPAVKSDSKSGSKNDLNPETESVVNPGSGIEKVETLASKAEANKNSAKSGKNNIQTPPWSYAGKQGPENWGKLQPEFSVCDTGRNQSPIDIDTTVVASLKPLKVSQKFPAKDIVNNGHTIEVSFKDGNMLMIDGTAFKMKQVNFHIPSEHTIRGKSYPLEAHFMHTDAKGNLAIIGVMFKIGSSNVGLDKLRQQLSYEIDLPKPLKARVLASEMLPENKNYYRFSGSLTTPPCSEGLRWLVMKTPVTASKAQIEAFERAIGYRNNRPVQPLNGRIIVE